MPRHTCLSVVLAVAVALSATLAVDLSGQGGGRGAGQRGRGAQPPRDTRAVPEGSAVIAGRVLAADNNRPVKRARVVVTGGGQPRATTTDEQGRFRVTGLPAGTYNVAASKTGFVDGTFGQRRVMRPGTPIELADNQQATADIKLARGGVITGHVFDEDGEPIARSMVTVLRSQYVRGERQLMPMGADQSDDRGQYRVFGLPPGDYFVSATAGGIDRLVAQIAQRAGEVEEQGTDSTGYAPTYYPGVISAAEAGRLKLAPAQEIAAIDFSIRVVPLATVRGVVAGGGTVVLIAESGVAAAGGGRGGGGGRGLGPALAGVLAGGQNLRAATQPDGSFVIRNVTPGRYTVVARADTGTGEPRMAMQSIAVSGDEITVALNPIPGTSLSGTITLEASSTPVPRSLTEFRVNAVALDSASVPGRGARLLESGDAGQFTFGVFPGRYVLRANGPRGWMMKSVYLDGRDVTDQSIEVKGDAIDGINVIFTDRIASLSGVVRDNRGGVEGLTVILFPEDANRWQPQSRQIAAVRTDKNGAYRFAAVPPGDYLVMAVDDVEQGEWFDPAFLDQIKDAATRVAVGDGEQRTQDLKAPSGS